MPVNFVTSRYIQICDWALIEYEYSTKPPKNLEYTTGNPDNIGIFRIENKITGEYHFANHSTENIKEITGNNLSWNVLPVKGARSKWASHNVTDHPKYQDSFDIIDPTDPEFLNKFPEEQPAISKVKYDTIRIHILSGYNFEGLDGFVVDVSLLENSKKKCRLSSAAYLRNQQNSNTTFNPNPIVLGERTYDKYITLKVPSFYEIQSDYEEYSANQKLFGNLYSHPVIPENPFSGGYLKDSPIYISLIELEFDSEDQEVNFYTTRQEYKSSVLNSDNYSGLSCNIKESERGDYFEYYPSWEGGYIGSYINILNQNGNWTVIHNLKVIEQIGKNFITTTDITIPQSSGFEKPSYFRPVILNSSTAFAYSILYTMRLINTESNEQIIRKANITKYNPKKYGLEIKRININEGIRPLKVYNKVIETVLPSQDTSQPIRTENLFTDSPKPIEKSKTKIIPQYYNQNNIAVNMSNSEALEIDTVLYGQGKCVIQLTKFDNIIKFIINEIEKDTIVPINLTRKQIYLKFVEDNNQTIKVESVKNEEVHPESGEIVFNLLKEQASKVLNIQEDKNFYLVNKGDDSDLETVIYIGRFEKFTEGYEIDKEFAKPINLKLNQFKTRMNNEVDEQIQLRKELEEEVKANNVLKEQLKRKITDYEDKVKELKGEISERMRETEELQEKMKTADEKKRELRDKIKELKDRPDRPPIIVSPIKELKPKKGIVKPKKEIKLDTEAPSLKKPRPPIAEREEEKERRSKESDRTTGRTGGARGTGGRTGGGTGSGAGDRTGGDTTTLRKL